VRHSRPWSLVTSAPISSSELPLHQNTGKIRDSIPAICDKTGKTNLSLGIEKSSTSLDISGAGAAQSNRLSLHSESVEMIRHKTAIAATLACVVVLVAAYFAIPSSRPPDGVINSRCPVRSDTKIVVYHGMGVTVVSEEWMRRFLNWWESHDATMKYVFLNATNLKSDCALSDYPNVRLCIQPGGDAYYQQSSLGAAGKANILEFLDRGGAYLGICAGWYYAATDYYYLGASYSWPDLLGRFPTVEGPIAEIAEDAEYNMTRMSNGLEMIYYGGPTRGWRQTSDIVPGTVLITFTAIPGDLPAAVKSKNLLLISVHPEAYEDLGIRGLTTEQRIANYKWLANAINEAAGLDFHAQLSVQTHTYGAFQHDPTPKRDRGGGLKEPFLESPTVLAHMGSWREAISVPAYGIEYRLCIDRVNPVSQSARG